MTLTWAALWPFLLTLLVGMLLGAGLVFWWLMLTEEHEKADCTINGWPAYHVGYKGESPERVKVYAVHERSFRWTAWATIDDGSPHRISYRAFASRSELMDMLTCPNSGKNGTFIIKDAVLPPHGGSR